MVVSENLMYAIETQTNTNIKFVVLVLLLIYSILLFLIKNKFDANKSMVNYWLRIFCHVLPIIYIVFTPLAFLFLLNINITMELFISIIMVGHLVMIPLVIGVGLFRGGELVTKIAGINDSKSFRDRIAERKSMRKYG